MAKAREYMRAEGFWGPVLVSSFFSLVGCLIISLIILGGVEAIENSLLRKEAIFCAMVGQPTAKYDQYDQDKLIGGKLKKSLRDLVLIGAYLRERSKKEPSQKVLAEAVATGRLFYGLDSREKERQKAVLVLEGKIPPEIIGALASEHWLALLDDSWNCQVMGELLKGDRQEAPIWNYDYPLGWLWWSSVLMTQFISFWVFLGSEHGYNKEEGKDYRWHQLPWHRGWPVLGFALLTPGAWPLMIPAWLRYLFSGERGRRRRQEKQEETKSIVREGTGEDLLIKLRKRLESQHV